jgi:hypothetical protein
MPNLNVDMIPRNSDSSIKGPVLQGQVSEWTLRISNHGTAAADKITLKTNVPWINILKHENGTKGNNEECQDSTSLCVGPSGTLMHIPILFQNTLSDRNVLKAGETTDIPIQIRTSGGGRQDFYMLFRYELSEQNSPKLSTPKVRWLRNMVSVAVYPSLTVTASLMPSSRGDNDHILSVEVSTSKETVCMCVLV